MPRQAFFYLFLIFVGGALGLYWGTQLLMIEKSWANSLATVKSANEKNAGQLDIDRRKLDELKGELTRTNLGWSQVWDDVQTNPNGVVLQVNIGTNQGLRYSQDANGNQVAPVLHAFRPQAEGFVYVGPFVAQAINADSANLAAAWTPIGAKANGAWQDESTTWAGFAGPNWRFRAQIPANVKVTFDGRVGRFHSNYNSFEEAQLQLQQQQEMFTAANEQRDMRNRELQGPPVGADPPAENDIDPNRPELAIGLVAAIENEEEARDVLQVEVDEIRRSIRDLSVRIQELESTLTSSQSANPTGTTRLGQKPN